jgi:hypothetical protein
MEVVDVGMGSRNADAGEAVKGDHRRLSVRPGCRPGQSEDTSYGSTMGKCWVWRGCNRDCGDEWWRVCIVYESKKSICKLRIDRKRETSGWEKDERMRKNEDRKTGCGHGREKGC